VLVRSWKSWVESSSAPFGKSSHHHCLPPPPLLLLLPCRHRSPVFACFRYWGFLLLIAIIILLFFVAVSFFFLSVLGFSPPLPPPHYHHHFFILLLLLCRRPSFVFGIRSFSSSSSLSSSSSSLWSSYFVYRVRSRGLEVCTGGKNGYRYEFPCFLQPLPISLYLI